MRDADWDKGEAVEVIFLYSGKECSLFPPQCSWGCWLRSWTLPFCVSATKDHELQGDRLALELGSHQLARGGCSSTWPESPRNCFIAMTMGKRWNLVLTREVFQGSRL